MYKEHFGLHTSPFALGSHLQFLYKSGAFEETMAHLVYGLKGGEDIVLITGGIGTGKTMALHNLVTHISSLYKVALINTTQIDYKELLKMVLIEVNVSYPPEADRADLLMILKGEIENAAAEGKRILLIVDEAQNLDTNTLEGLRLLTNLAKTDEQALQLVLVGQPGLLESLDSKELIQLKQRIRVHYHLITLTPKEMKEYIEHRLTVAGCRKKVFDESAYKRIYKLSEGVPRLVNIIADKSMLKAFVDRAKLVSAKHVEEMDYAKSTTDIKQVSEKPEPAPVEEVVVSDEDPAPQRPSKKFNIRAVLWAVIIAVVVLGLYFQPWKYFATAVEVPDEVEVAESPIIAETEVNSVVIEEIQETVHEQETTPVQEPVQEAVQEPAQEQEPFLEQEETIAEDRSWPEPEPEKFWVHVGSFQNKENAEALATKLADSGFNIAVNSSELAGAVYHRVFTGPALSKDHAQEIAAEVKTAEGVGYTMVKYIR